MFFSTVVGGPLFGFRVRTTRFGANGKAPTSTGVNVHNNGTPPSAIKQKHRQLPMFSATCPKTKKEDPRSYWAGVQFVYQPKLGSFRQQANFGCIPFILGGPVVARMPASVRERVSDKDGGCSRGSPTQPSDFLCCCAIRPQPNAPHPITSDFGCPFWKSWHFPLELAASF